MTTEKKIQAALSPIGLPTALDFYDPETDPDNLDGSQPDAYIVYNLADQRPASWADDQPDTDTEVWQVHYFSRLSTNLIREIRRFLREAGFTIQSINKLYENDTKYKHAVLTVSVLSASETQED